jgi:hypothetical protein
MEMASNGSEVTIAHRGRIHVNYDLLIEEIDRGMALDNLSDKWNVVRMPVPSVYFHLA